MITDLRRCMENGIVNIADKFLDAEGKKMDTFMEHFGREIEE